MNKLGVDIRLMEPAEIPLMVDYFLKADDLLLDRMGVDPERLPDRAEWIGLVEDDFERPMSERKYLYMVGVMGGKPIGHCNVNKIIFGQEAYMHLHLWDAGNRQTGLGTSMVGQSLPVFCESLELPVVFCEPKADNPAPNRTLAAVGFELVDTYVTTPGWLNYEQTVNRWRYACPARS